jgi:hypothetical protein
VVARRIVIRDGCAEARRLHRWARMWKIVVLAVLGGCSLYYPDRASAGTAGSGGAEETAHLDGTWPLTRALVSANPVAPRTAPCTEGFTTGYQPTTMTIVGMVVGTDYGTPLTNVTFGGAHDLSFDAAEYWNTVGWNQLHPLHYDFDQAANGMLESTVTSTPNWPNGACAYTYIIASTRQN